MRLTTRTAMVLSLAALTLTGCAGDAAGENTAGENISQDSYVEVTDAQGAIEGFVGAAEDAEVTRCEADAQAWVGEGTVTNPTAEAQSYRIYVAFNENRDTKGLVQVDVASVAAGETAEWRAEVPIAADSLSCVLRVERFSPL